MVDNTRVPSRDRLDLSERLFLLFLVKETYGEHRLYLESSLEDLQSGARAVYGVGKDSRKLCERGFTKPRLSRALRKFERLGFLKVSPLLAVVHG